MQDDRLYIELCLPEAEADSKNPSEWLEWLRAKGVPDTVIFRLARLTRRLIRIGKRVIQAGRIILAKLCDFIEVQPGLAIGAALGTALDFVTAHVPLIGHMLTPTLVVVGTWFDAAYVISSCMMGSICLKGLVRSNETLRRVPCTKDGFDGH